MFACLWGKPSKAEHAVGGIALLSAWKQQPKTPVSNPQSATPAALVLSHGLSGAGQALPGDDLAQVVKTLPERRQTQAQVRPAAQPDKQASFALIQAHNYQERSEHRSATWSRCSKGIDEQPVAEQSTLACSAVKPGVGSEAFPAGLQPCQLPPLGLSFSKRQSVVTVHAAAAAAVALLHHTAARPGPPAHLLDLGSSSVLPLQQGGEQLRQRVGTEGTEASGLVTGTGSISEDDFMDDLQPDGASSSCNSIYALRTHNIAPATHTEDCITRPFTPTMVFGRQSRQSLLSEGSSRAHEALFIRESLAALRNVCIAPGSESSQDEHILPGLPRIRNMSQVCTPTASFTSAAANAPAAQHGAVLAALFADGSTGKTSAWQLAAPPRSLHALKLSIAGGGDGLPAESDLAMGPEKIAEQLRDIFAQALSSSGLSSHVPSSSGCPSSSMSTSHTANAGAGSNSAALGSQQHTFVQRLVRRKWSPFATGQPACPHRLSHSSSSLCVSTHASGNTSEGTTQSNSALSSSAGAGAANRTLAAIEEQPQVQSLLSSQESGRQPLAAQEQLPDEEAVGNGLVQAAGLPALPLLAARPGPCRFFDLGQPSVRGDSPALRLEPAQPGDSGHVVAAIEVSRPAYVCQLSALQKHALPAEGVCKNGMGMRAVHADQDQGQMQDQQHDQQQQEELQEEQQQQQQQHTDSPLLKTLVATRWSPFAQMAIMAASHAQANTAGEQQAVVTPLQAVL